jgi:hypothetical protein
MQIIPCCCSIHDWVDGYLKDVLTTLTAYARLFDLLKLTVFIYSIWGAGELGRPI